VAVVGLRRNNNNNNENMSNLTGDQDGIASSRPPSQPPSQEQQQQQQQMLASTTAPGKFFSSRTELQEHYRSDWHKYNLYVLLNNCSAAWCVFRYTFCPES